MIKKPQFEKTPWETSNFYFLGFLRVVTRICSWPCLRCIQAEYNLVSNKKRPFGEQVSLKATRMLQCNNSGKTEEVDESNRTGKTDDLAGTFFLLLQ